MTEFNAVSVEELTAVGGGDWKEALGFVAVCVICPPLGVGIALGYTATKIAQH